MANRPTRIVSLQPSATVILADLGCLDRVVACTKYCCDIVPGIGNSGKMIVSDSWTANRDQILAAEPDFVVASVPYQLEAVADILKAGIRFLGLAPHTLRDIYLDIAAIAGIMGYAERGDAIVAAMQEEITYVRETVCETGRPRYRVFCEEWGKPIIASQGWVAELVEAVGGEFVGEPGKQTTPEWVRAADPDVLIAAWCGAGDRVPLEKMVALRGWDQMRAVHRRQMFCIPDEYLNTPAQTLTQGLYALAAALHPDLFSRTFALRQIDPMPPVNS